METKRIVEGTGLGFMKVRRVGPLRVSIDLRREFMAAVHSVVFNRSSLPLELRQKIWKKALTWCPIMGGSIGDTFESDLLSLIFTATAIADLADDDQTSPATTLTFALHTGDPGEAGTQLTNEAAYTSYARQTVARTTGGFTVTSGSVSPDANIDFTAATGGSETETHFSVGTGVSNKLLFSGTVTPNIAVSNGVTPRLTTATAITLD